MRHGVHDTSYFEIMRTQIVNKVLSYLDRKGGDGETHSIIFLTNNTEQQRKVDSGGDQKDATDFLKLVDW